jgi:histidinol-phosphate aminotransferase
MDREEVLNVIRRFRGIVIVDEAYIDFSSQPSFVKELENFPNLIVFQTFSKAWASAGVRLGMAFASVEVISLFNKVKYPYNINILTQNYALDLLNNYGDIENWIQMIMQERDTLKQELSRLSIVEKIYPTDANFFLVKVRDANRTYQYLVRKGIIVRNRNNISLCSDCLRVTVGTRKENQSLIMVLEKMNEQ